MTKNKKTFEAAMRLNKIIVISAIFDKLVSKDKTITDDLYIIKKETGFTFKTLGYANIRDKFMTFNTDILLMLKQVYPEYFDKEEQYLDHVIKIDVVARLVEELMNYDTADLEDIVKKLKK